MLIRALRGLCLVSNKNWAKLDMPTGQAVFQMKLNSTEIDANPESVLDSEKRLKKLNKTFMTNPFALYVKDKYKLVNEQNQGIFKTNSFLYYSGFSNIPFVLKLCLKKKL
jgi:hypothetical protein